jgi:hypothetical protein
MSTFLVRVTSNSHAPAAYVIIAAIITLVILLRTGETAFAPLRQSRKSASARRRCWQPVSTDHAGDGHGDMNSLAPLLVAGAFFRRALQRTGLA